MAACPGLSPRTRGNQQLLDATLHKRGSIPANAGEPSRRAFLFMPARVYPRERGGTLIGETIGKSGAGLSPRTRGNHGGPGHEAGMQGSIPANAGEPCWRCPGHRQLRVYPRERGGTPEWQGVIAYDQGLSPRTRGNREPWRLATAMKRSIPANAGEPRWSAIRHPLKRVYPRERGGTHDLGLEKYDVLGLSPRTRGNLDVGTGLFSQSGSIPAYAGEPTWNMPQCPSIRVYPRERGGTRVQ